MCVVVGGSAAYLVPYKKLKAKTKTKPYKGERERAEAGKGLYSLLWEVQSMNTA